MSPRIATVLSDQDYQFIDHLSPLSDLLKIPMVVSDQEIAALICTYYPEVELIYKEPLELGFYLLKYFDIVYTCLPNPLFRELVFVAEAIENKTLFNVWCPHGNSDKGRRVPFMETLCQEQFTLVYGQKMLDFLRENSAFDRLKGFLITGNYRLNYYKKRKEFFQNKLQAQLTLKKGKTLLYAPTWKDGENSSSLEGALSHLVDGLPDHLNLLIKPHPNTLRCPADLESLLSQISGKRNIQLLTHFPPIYPVLDFIDIYLGDMSSIGYDCLSFKKPLFFLNGSKRAPNKERGLFLMQCGRLIEPREYSNIFSIIENTDPSPFQEIQNALYAQVFGKEENLKDQVIAAYEKTT